MSQENRGSPLNLERISGIPHNSEVIGNMPKKLKYRHDRNPNVGQSNNQVKTNTVIEKETTPVPTPNKRLFVPDSDSDTSRPASKKSNRPLDSLRVSGEENKLLSLLQSRMRDSKSNSPRRQTPTRSPQNIVQNRENRQISSPNTSIHNLATQFTTANRSYTTPSNNNKRNIVDSNNVIRSDPQITGDSRISSRQASLNFQRTPSTSNKTSNNNLHNLEPLNETSTSFRESMKQLLSKNYNGSKYRQNETRPIISADHNQILNTAQVPNSKSTAQPNGSRQNSNRGTPNKMQVPNSQQTPNNTTITYKNSSTTRPTDHQNTVSTTTGSMTSKVHSDSQDKSAKIKEKPFVIDLLYLDDEEDEEVRGKKKNDTENESHKEQVQQIEKTADEKDHSEEDESEVESSSVSSHEYNDEKKRDNLEMGKNLESESEESEEESQQESEAKSEEDSEEESENESIDDIGGDLNNRYTAKKKIGANTKDKSRTQKSSIGKLSPTRKKTYSDEGGEFVAPKAESTQIDNQTSLEIDSSNKNRYNKTVPISEDSREYFYGNSKPPPERVADIVRSVGIKDSIPTSDEIDKDNVPENLLIKTPVPDDNKKASNIPVINPIPNSAQNVAYNKQKISVNSLVNHYKLVPENKNENKVTEISVDLTNFLQRTAKNHDKETPKDTQPIPDSQSKATENLSDVTTTKGHGFGLSSNISSQSNQPTSKDTISSFHVASQTAESAEVVSKVTNIPVQENQTNRNVSHDNANTTHLNTQELPAIQASELKRKHSMLDQTIPIINGPDSKLPRLGTEKPNVSNDAKSKTNMNNGTGDTTSPSMRLTSPEVLPAPESASKPKESLHVQPDIPIQENGSHTASVIYTDTEDKAPNLSSQGSTNVVKLEESGNLKDGIIQSYYRPLRNGLRTSDNANKNGSRHAATLEVIYISDSDSEEGEEESDQQLSNEISNKSNSSDNDDKAESEQEEEKNQSDQIEEVGTKRADEYNYIVNINYNDDKSSDMGEDERVKLIKKYDVTLGRNLLKYLNPPQPFKKSGLLRLLDGGIIKHTPLSLNDTVSSTNDVCNRDNFESSPVLFYQRLHKKSRLAEERPSYELTNDFFNRGANLIADGKHAEMENELTGSAILNGDIQGSNEMNNKLKAGIQQNDDDHPMDTVNTNDTPLPTEKIIENDKDISKEMTPLKGKGVLNETIDSNGLGSPVIMQDLEEANVRDESNISRKDDLPTKAAVHNEENLTDETSTETTSNITKDKSVEKNKESDIVTAASTNIPNPEENNIQKDTGLTTNSAVKTKSNDAEEDLGTSKPINEISSSKMETSSTTIQPEASSKDTEDKEIDKKLTSREKWRNAWITNLKACPFYPYEGYPKTALTVESRRKLNSSFEVIKDTLQEKYQAPIMSEFTQETYIILLKGEQSDFKNDEEFQKIYAFAEKAINGRKMRIWSFNKVSKFLLHMDKIPSPVLDKKGTDNNREQENEKSNNTISETRQESDNKIHEARKVSKANEKDKSNEDTQGTEKAHDDYSKNKLVDNTLKTNASSKGGLRKSEKDNTSHLQETTVKGQTGGSIQVTKEETNKNEKEEDNLKKSLTTAASQDITAASESQDSGSVVTHTNRGPNVEPQKVDSSIRSMSSGLGNTVVQQHSFVPASDNTTEERLSIKTSNVVPVPINPDDSNIVVSQTNSQETIDRVHSIYKEQENGRIITEMMTNLEDLVTELSAELKKEQEANEKARECILELSNKLLEQEIANSRLKSSLEIEKTTKQYVEEQNLQLGDALKRLKDQQKLDVYITGMRLRKRDNTTSQDTV